ncbi:YgiT-type zinc finger protein [Aggregatilinea lenta]|uniref:YgiT-type zinc finger protein n=1 Tax=Aggregatilinea lenta TaxID=913108 RepID=UPI000E5A3B01|nr:YgiT-type zinc finger protein [Aggregatilinea lenta]
MATCTVCGGKMKSAREDVVRVIEGQPVRVLDLSVNKCTVCGAITLKRWFSLKEIDAMLQDRLKHTQFDAITWEQLISEYALPAMMIM